MKLRLEDVLLEDTHVDQHHLAFPDISLNE